MTVSIQLAAGETPDWRAMWRGWWADHPAKLFVATGGDDVNHYIRTHKDVFGGLESQVLNWWTDAGRRNAPQLFELRNSALYVDWGDKGASVPAAEMGEDAVQYVIGNLRHTCGHGQPLRVVGAIALTSWGRANFRPDIAEVSG